MKVQEARDIGERIATLVADWQFEAANVLLYPVLAERTPFRLLDEIGERIGKEPPEVVHPFLDQVAGQRTMGGVAVHYWAKQAKGAARCQPQARALLDLLEPMFSERKADTIKGVGWGMKTLGKYYPDLVADWLVQQAGRPHRALIVRKATTYLPMEKRKRVKEKLS